MKILFRATDEFFAVMRRDLMRRHAFAHERVGFIAARAAKGEDHIALLAETYHPVADEDYIPDPTVGVRIGQEALRKALNLALLNPVGIFHVHMHLMPTRRLWFSQVDLSEQRNFVPDFFKVRSTMPHGALVLSPRSVAGLTWTAPKEVQIIDEFNAVGEHLKVIHAARDGSTEY